LLRWRCSWAGGAEPGAAGGGRAAARPAQRAVSGPALVELHVAVVDENGTAVASARITLTPKLGLPVHGETDYAGRKEFSAGAR